MAHNLKLGLLLLSTLGSHAFAGSPSAAARFEALAKSTDGRVGICALDTPGAAPSCVNGDQNFSIQSVMKLVVTAAVMDAVDRGRLRLDDVIVVKPAHASPGPQDFANLVKAKGSLATPIEELMRRAVVDSDSTSVDVLLDHIGGVEVVGTFLKRNGIGGLRVDRNERQLQAESVGLAWRAEFADEKAFDAALKALPTEKRDAAWNAYVKDPRDTATPRGMVAFLDALAHGRLLSAASTRKLLDVMESTVTGPRRLRAGVPKDWRIGHKTGTSRGWKGMVAATNDVGILTSPSGKRIPIAVFVADSKRTTAEREAVIAAAARIVTGAPPPTN